jgi:hypothetical protein
MTRYLQILGLKKRGLKDVTPTLSDIIKEHEEPAPGLDIGGGQ